MSIGRTSRAARAAVAAALLLVAMTPLVSGSASGAETIGDLKARMAQAQARLDESTAKLETLEQQLDLSSDRIAEIEGRMKVLEQRDAKLEAKAVDRARAMYMAGNSEVFEVLFGAESFSEMSDAVEMLSQLNIGDSGAFVALARSRAELLKLEKGLVGERSKLKDALQRMKEENDRQQAMFDSLAADYGSLQDRVSPSGISAARIRGVGGMYCPVAGPVSFVDSWGAPRSGHTHQGVDMMGAYGTPLVAIVSGTITYAAWDGSGGNMIFLSGDDGNAYWYMHNQQNLRSGGHVGAGEQIATLGDTGNAEGTPHLHFEYHPGGGSAVNPTPLVASIC